MRLGEIVVIHNLKRQGLSVTAIARKVGLDRKTVRRHLERGLEAPAYGPRPPRERLIDPFADYLRERVTSYPDLSGRRLLREVRDLGYTGCYSRVTDLLRGVRPPRRARFERRFETPPRPPGAGRLRPVSGSSSPTSPASRGVVWLFSLVLGHSRWLWGRFCAAQDLQTVMRCHIDAFAAMGGAPSELLYDRMKTAVIGEDAEGVVSYNASLGGAPEPLRRDPPRLPPVPRQDQGQGGAALPLRPPGLLPRALLPRHGRPQPPVRRLAGRDRQRPRPRHHGPGSWPSTSRGAAGSDRASRHLLQRRSDDRAAGEPRWEWCRSGATSTRSPTPRGSGSSRCRATPGRCASSKTAP